MITDFNNYFTFTSNISIYDATGTVTTQSPSLFRNSTVTWSDSNNLFSNIPNIVQANRTAHSLDGNVNNSTVTPQTTVTSTGVTVNAITSSGVTVADPVQGQSGRETLPSATTGYTLMTVETSQNSSIVRNVISEFFSSFVLLNFVQIGQTCLKT